MKLGILQPRHVTYEEQTIDAANPIVRFAHRRRMALSLEITLRVIPQGGAVADFGAGTGYFLHRLREIRPDLRLHGIEPYMTSVFGDVRFVPDFASIADRSLDLVTAFEVCEHLRDDEIDSFIENTARTLRPQGMLAISVPIMYGLAILPKELNQMMLMRRRSEYTAAEITRAFLGLPVARPSDPKHTHKAFDFRVLRARLEQAFDLKTTVLSPFNMLPWFVNSQVFFCLSKKR